MRRPLSIIAYGMVLILVVSVAVQANQAGLASQSQISNLKSPIPPKWDTGQKDLLTSMEAESAKSSEAKDESPMVTFLSFMFKLAVVVALAYGTICALKRFNVSTFKRSSGQTIKVLENTNLGPNRALHVIEIGSKRLLVASTTSQISLLTELCEGEASAESNEGVTTDVPQLSTLNSQLSTSFKDQLSTFLGARPNTGDSAANVAQMIRGSSTFLQEKIMELGRLRRGFKDA